MRPFSLTRERMPRSFYSVLSAFCTREHSVDAYFDLFWNIASRSPGSSEHPLCSVRPSPFSSTRCSFPPRYTEGNWSLARYGSRTRSDRFDSLRYGCPFSVNNEISRAHDEPVTHRNCPNFRKYVNSYKCYYFLVSG